MSKRKHKRAIAGCADNGNVSVAAPLPSHSPPVPDAQSDPNAEAKQTQREADDKVYDSYRESLVNLEQDTAKEYDKWVLTLAGVLLGFSLTLVKDFIRPSGVAMQQPWCLYTAWFALALPLALGLLNLQLSYSATKKYRFILDAQYEKYDETPNFWKETLRLMKCVWRNRFIEAFNWVSLVSFMAGIGFLVAFVYHNVSGEKHEQWQQAPAQRSPIDPASTFQPEAERAAPTTNATTTPKGSLDRNAPYAPYPRQGATSNPTTQQKG